MSKGEAKNLTRNWLRHLDEEMNGFKRKPRCYWGKSEFVAKCLVVDLFCVIMLEALVVYPENCTSFDCLETNFAACQSKDKTKWIFLVNVDFRLYCSNYQLHALCSSNLCLLKNSSTYSKVVRNMQGKI